MMKMREETCNLIVSSNLINNTTKNALKLSVDSNNIFYDDSFVEDHLDIEHASKKEKLNEEIKARVNFNPSDIKRTYLSARLTNDLVDKPVFARVIENKYFEKIVTFNKGRFEYEGIPLEIVKSMNNLSSVVRNNLSKTELSNWSASVLRLMTQDIPGPLSNIEYDAIEQVCINLFLNDFNNFSMFIDKIDSIENLSAAIFSKITFKTILISYDTLSSKI